MFLDITMPGRLGVDLLGSIPQGTAVVFVTAREGYAVEAFRSGAVDYVLKPFDHDRLAITVERLEKRFAANEGRGTGEPAAADLGGDRTKAREISGDEGQAVRLASGRGAGFGSDADQAVPVVSDQQVAVRLDLQPVGPAGIGCDLGPVVVLDPEDAAVGDVGDIQPPLGVEGGAFEERVNGRASTIGIRPFRAFQTPEMVGQAGEQAGGDFPGWIEEHGGRVGDAPGSWQEVCPQDR